MAKNEVAKVTVPVSQNQKRILESMSEPTREKAVQIRELSIQSDLGQVRLAFKQGSVLNEVRDNEAEYGSKAVEQIAEFLEIAPDRLYRFGNFARSFEQEFVLKWQAKANSKGHMLTVEHWLQLSQVTDPDKQEKWLTHWQKESISALELGAVIRSAGDSGSRRRSVKGGRKPSEPKTPMAGVQKGDSLLHTLMNYMPTFEKCTLKPLDSLPYEELPVDKIDVAEKLLSNMEAAEELIHEAHSRLVKSVERMRTAKTTLAAKAKEDKAKSPKVPVAKAKKKKKKDKKEKTSKRPTASTVA